MDDYWESGYSNIPKKETLGDCRLCGTLFLFNPEKDWEFSDGADGTKFKRFHCIGCGHILFNEWLVAIHRWAKTSKPNRPVYVEPEPKPYAKQNLKLAWRKRQNAGRL